MEKCCPMYNAFIAYDGGGKAESRVRGKLAIVTGSARSIEAGIVRKLASKGCNNIISYATTSSDDAAATLKAELESKHCIKVITVRADISTSAGCEQIIAAAKENFKNSNTGAQQIDILVHNAAVLYIGPPESVIEKEFHHIYAVNVLGPTLLTAACKPFLPTDRSGRIVMMSSINSKIGTLHTTLELTERATGNAVNCGRAAYDHEIAGIIAIICDPDSSWMTGRLISANYGLFFSM
ncbi:hypothetical protein BCON_0143g00120 [Botryotinia convoluta]|uniref:Ketoreductase (KR) domain-containing protein n=1 Tax=Botryotinia convoluta TaxID=54673 RepID=A0A4Z1I0R4_9HELO|nr:hypothetical protein BCON_0143g00120 [Botryotinia convoluta]